MPPASAILSPLAAPFYPSSNMEEECPFSVIYSNGIPTGLINEHESIANIPDYTIDEKFPPTAVDAAEMDAVDDFLNVMVDLSFIEDREERGRTDIGSVASRRWEAKRQEGLKGRPHLSYGSVERIIHEANQMNKNEKRLIPNARHSAHLFDEKRNNKNSTLHSQVHTQKRNASAHRYTKSIQQPRKQN
jgi:hypothetical protein